MPALDDVFEPLSRCFDARRILAMQVAEPVHQRISFLANRANEGELTDEERTEYDALISATSFYRS